MLQQYPHVNPIQALIAPRLLRTSRRCKSANPCEVDHPKCFPTHSPLSPTRFTAISSDGDGLDDSINLLDASTRGLTAAGKIFVTQYAELQHCGLGDEVDPLTESVSSSDSQTEIEDDEGNQGPTPTPAEPTPDDDDSPEVDVSSSEGTGAGFTALDTVNIVFCARPRTLKTTAHEKLLTICSTHIEWRL